MCVYDMDSPADLQCPKMPADPPVAAVVGVLTEFLDYYATPALVDRGFMDTIGGGPGGQRLERLLAAAGFSGDAPGFCRALAERLTAPVPGGGRGVELNGVCLPQPLLLAVLEKLLPGDRFFSIHTVDRLEALTLQPVSPERRAAMQQVLDLYPVRLSTHVVRQMLASRNVAYQYLPFVEELDPAGHVNTWIGQFHKGLLEQMYQNRVIFLLNMSCPVYCRFCFRKHKDSRKQANPTPADVQNAVDYVRHTPTIKEIVVTGGDPFMNRKNLAAAIDGLMQVPHVQTLRLATRSIAYYPNLFYAGSASLLNYVKAKHLELQAAGKRLEIATHFIHPDEISVQSLDLITEFTRSGIAVYVQTPFLKDCNDQGPELAQLFRLLRGAGAELHYIYIPCSPIQGNRVYWSSIADGLRAAHYLRARLSDRAIPRMCTATPIGKIDWHSSGWAIERDAANERFIWIRTPYTPDYFKAFAPLANELDIVRVNAEGTLDVRYMADIGDDRLLLGHRPPVPPVPAYREPEVLAGLQQAASADPCTGIAVVRATAAGVKRVHETRVEIDLAQWDGDIAAAVRDDAITDVVLTGAGDTIPHLGRVERTAAALERLPHVNALRLRSLAFAYRPSEFTAAVIDRIGGLNRLRVVCPLRVEIETQFLHASEITGEHRRLTERLRLRGVTVYSNTPLLAGINDSPDDISRIAFRLREAGIEFHHVVVAGHPLQQGRGEHRPLDVARVVDIGTRVRKDGSGREIPRYILQTRLGEVDFGLTSTLYRQGDRFFVRLAPYRLADFRRMQPDFQWPADTLVDPDGAPVLPVSGLADSGGFMVCQGLPAPAVR